MMDCENCGLNDWEFIDGIACCNECGTSSQNVVEEQHKETDNRNVIPQGVVRFKGEKKKSTSIDEGYKWKLHEGLTVVLKEYVQVLTKLGASPELSATTLQVWKQLLQSTKLKEYKRGRGQCVDGLMLPSLVSVLHVSCVLLNQQFYPSDFIRWTREEHLPYASSLNVLPETWKQKSLFDGFFVVNSFFWPNHQHVRKVTQFYLDILHIKPTLDWDFSIIIKRQLEEMQLPDDLSDLVKQLCHTTLQRELPEKLIKIVLYKDLFSMAAIIVSLKIVLGLNGVHENKKAPNGGKMMFDWNDWVKYIELRRALVRHVSPSQHCHLFRTSGARLFPAQKCYQHLAADEVRRSINMIASTSDPSDWKSQPSFYPTWGVLYQYLETHPESLPDDVRQTLCTNYNTETSIHSREGCDPELSNISIKRVTYERWDDRDRFNKHILFREQAADKELTDKATNCEVVADATCFSYWRSMWDKDGRDQKHNAHLMCQHFPSIYLWLLEFCAETLHTSAEDLQQFVDEIDNHVLQI